MVVPIDWVSMVKGWVNKGALFGQGCECGRMMCDLGVAEMGGCLNAVY